MKIQFWRSTLTVATIVTLSSCAESAAGPQPQVDDLGLTADVYTVVPRSLIDTMVNLGFVVYGGARPPSVEGTFLVSPLSLLATSVPGESAPDAYPSPLTIRLYEQDNQALTIKEDFVVGSEVGSAIGGFIVGTGQSFTMFLRVNATLVTDSATYTARGVTAASGRVTSAGIESYRYFTMVLDHEGAPPGVWIPVGTGRLFADGDGLSTRQPEAAVLRASAHKTDQATVAGARTLRP